MPKPKWKFSEEWERKVRNIALNELFNNEEWLRSIIRDEFQKIEAARGSR